MTDVAHSKEVTTLVQETMGNDVIFLRQVESASDSIHVKSYGHSSNDWTFGSKER
jgi:hypothetical protein